MEVFIHNLPPQGNFTSKGLKTQLQGFTRRLGIADHTYECDKNPRKKVGHVTFLYKQDGQRFLQNHGQIDIPGQKRPKSQLSIMGHGVFCVVSNKSPDKFTLNHLAMEHEKEMKPRPAEDQKNRPVAFGLQHIYCGYPKYIGGELAFAPEVDWSTRASGTATFGKRIFIATFPQSNGQGRQLEIQIPLHTVNEVLWSEDQGLLTLMLASVPLFFEVGQGLSDAFQELGLGYFQPKPKRTRLTSLDATHALYIGTCLVYQFAVSQQDFSRKINSLRARDTLPISRFALRYHQEQQDTSTCLELLNDRLRQYSTRGDLPFEILFQLQALAYNTYLHPRIVYLLALRLKGIHFLDISSRQTSFSVESMKALMQGSKFTDMILPHHLRGQESDPIAFQFSGPAQTQTRPNSLLRLWSNT